MKENGVKPAENRIKITKDDNGEKEEDDDDEVSCVPHGY
jgi:hypothetical protein